MAEIYKVYFETYIVASYFFTELLSGAPILITRDSNLHMSDEEALESNQPVNYQCHTHPRWMHCLFSINCDYDLMY